MLNVAMDLRAAMRDAPAPVDVTIVMPCLNEAESLPHCIGNAFDALDRMAASGLYGEVLIADNGSTDGSRDLARRLGARVVEVAERGYGAAIIGGCAAASGRFLLIGDADGSYDFTDGVAMIDRLADGAALCMGSRFKGGIAPGAMPWKNRHIGNPVLTGILNLFFRAGIDDAHCGLRAIRKDAFLALRLSGPGMEFASEMVVKAKLQHMSIAEVPARLAVDRRNRAPHLRPWRDGWRHLRYLLMMSPAWVFGVPAAVAFGLGALILAIASLHFAGVLPGARRFGESWSIVAGFLCTCGHVAGLMAIAMHLHGVREGYRSLSPLLRRIAGALRLETMLSFGSMLIVLAVVLLAGVAWNWSAHSFAPLATVLPLVVAAVIGTIGLQTIFGGFVLAIVAGHSANPVPAEARPVLVGPRPLVLESAVE